MHSVWNGPLSQGRSLLVLSSEDHAGDSAAARVYWDSLLFSVWWGRALPHDMHTGFSLCELDSPYGLSLWSRPYPLSTKGHVCVWVLGPTSCGSIHTVSSKINKQLTEPLKGKTLMESDVVN